MKKNKNYIIFFITIATMVAFLLNFEGIYDGTIKNSNIFKTELWTSSIIIFLIYGYYTKFLNLKTTTSKKILSIIFSILMILGYSYSKVNSWDLVFGNWGMFLLSIISAIGYFCFFQSIWPILDEVLKKIPTKPLIVKNNKIIRWFLDKFEEHPVLTSLIVILIGWSIYILAFYPIILSPDPSFQIKQYFNEPTKYIDWVIQVDENVNMTTHHPVIHTFLLGFCIQVGRMIANDNFGLFTYSILQTLTLSLVFSYSIYFLKKHKVSNKLRLVVLGIYTLVPMFPLYAMSGVKDTYYTAFIILYTLLLFDIIHSKRKINFKKAINIAILMLLIALFRNNGLYVILLSFPLIILYNKKQRKILVTSLIIFLLGFTSFNKILIPKLGISEGSIREVLSIPFQQTARYVKEHEKDVTEEEKEIIDKILGYEDLATRYDPEKADPVKNEYNKYTTTEDLKAYFKIWFQGLIKHPDTYVQATINNVYGYFYPNSTKWYIYYKYDNRITQNDLVDYHYNSLNNLRKTLSNYGVNFPYIPIIGFLTNIGFSAWIMFIMIAYCIEKKKKQYILVLSPLLVSLLVCVASPVNTYFRYSMPYIFVMPVLFCLMHKVLRSTYEKK
ncbi:MAG: hypothetical protein E7168_01535 [Firmicutes bacterium]|nr:hypothetical protein [Bacillota bacterium]